MSLQTSLGSMPSGSQGAETKLAVRWNAVLAGMVISLAMTVTLFSLGLAFGLSSVDVEAGNSWRALGLFAGLWGALTPLISLFVGGWVASRSASAGSQAAAVIHGMVLWGVTSLALIWGIGGIISGLLGGAASITTGAAQLGGSAIVSGLKGATEIGSSLGQLGAGQMKFELNTHDIFNPVNERLKAEGKATISPDDVNEALKDLLSQAVSKGRLDREMVTNTLSHKFPITEKEMKSIADRAENDFNAAKEKFEEAQSRLKEKLEDARHTATQHLEVGLNRAADVSGKAFMRLALALVLALVASVAGALTSQAVLKKDEN